MDSLQIDGPAGRTFQLCTIILLKSFLILFCFFFFYDVKNVWKLGKGANDLSNNL